MSLMIMWVLCFHEINIILVSFLVLYNHLDVFFKNTSITAVLLSSKYLLIMMFEINLMSIA